MYTYVKNTERKRERGLVYIRNRRQQTAFSLKHLDIMWRNRPGLWQLHSFGPDVFLWLLPPLSLVGLSSFSVYPLNVIISWHVSSTYSLLVNVPEQNMALMAYIPYTCLLSWCNAGLMAHSHCSPTDLSAFMWQLDMSDSNLSLTLLSSDLYSWTCNFLANYLTENKHQFYLCS